MKALDPIDYSALCPGIAGTVRWLRERGFDTTDSGDGVSNAGMECALPMPNVAMVVPSEIMLTECDRLYRAVVDAGITPDGDSVNVEASYSPVDGVGMLLLLGVDDAMLLGTKP